MAPGPPLPRRPRPPLLRSGWVLQWNSPCGSNRADPRCTHRWWADCSLDYSVAAGPPEEAENRVETVKQL